MFGVKASWTQEAIAGRQVSIKKRLPSGGLVPEARNSGHLGNPSRGRREAGARDVPLRFAAPNHIFLGRNQRFHWLQGPSDCSRHRHARSPGVIGAYPDRIGQRRNDRKGIVARMKITACQ